MNTTRQERWLPAAAIAGIVYFVVGYGSALLDPSVPGHIVVAWRLAAWVASAAVFAAHIGYEHFSRHERPVAAAAHVALAVALGAFLLALAAAIHAATVQSHAPWLRHLLALVLWPAVTALPAFVVALAASALLVVIRRRAPRVA